MMHAVSRMVARLNIRTGEPVRQERVSSGVIGVALIIGQVSRKA
jgi:hypothetical protein